MATTSTLTRPHGRSRRPKLVHQFLIVLSRTSPLVWRRLQVPQAYSFWDLHVAIQDAMGWLDCRLHEFRLLDPDEQRIVSIGTPTDEPADRPVAAGWDVPLSNVFERSAWHVPLALYTYDFSTDWQHVVAHEGLEPADAASRYPRCVGGARRCPPEGCGGVLGFEELLRTISDPAHPKHASMREWVGEDYDPAAFEPDAVVFDDPRKRLKKVLRR